MKSKSFLVAALTALALSLLTGTASATTLEVKGVKQTGAVTIKASHESFSSTGYEETGLGFLNTCTTSSFEATTSTFTGTTVTAPVKNLTFSNCIEGSVTVDAAGSISIENIPGTTNGTVRWIGTKVTVPSFFGTLTCTSASSPGTHAGTLIGVASGRATLRITPVLNCGFFMPSAFWLGTYVITSPEGLGVTS